jgi:general stress protein YciG
MTLVNGTVAGVRLCQPAATPFATFASPSVANCCNLRLRYAAGSLHKWPLSGHLGPSSTWSRGIDFDNRWGGTSARHEDGGVIVTITERKERRGFASMSPEKQREIASKGGRAAHEKGTAHEWTADEARSAGRKGGQVSRGGRGRLVGEPQIGLQSGGFEPPVSVSGERSTVGRPE